MLTEYIQQKYIYSTETCSPTQRPEGAQTPSNCHISPKCWQNISNTNIFILLTHVSQPSARRAHRHLSTVIYPPIVGMVYQISTYIFNCHIPTKLLASYIQYKHIFLKMLIPQPCALKGTQKPSNLHSSSKCWHDISNINTYIQLNIFPKLLAAYIQYNWLFYRNVHFPTLCPKGTKKPSNLHLSPNCWHGISNINIYIQLNYTPQIVGSLYPIQLDIL